MNRDIGIDIGTKNTYIYAASHGSVSCEPSAAAVDAVTGRPIALGAGAKQLVMRTPGCTRLIYPLGDGLTAAENADFRSKLLGYHTARNKSGRIFSPKVAVAVEPDISEDEEAALTRAVLEAGASEAVFIEAPLAAAVGSGRDVYSSTPTVIIDAGASKTSAAIIADGQVRHYTVTSAGGNAIDAAILEYIRNKYRLNIQPETAEDLKILYVSLASRRGHGDNIAQVTGTALRSGLPQTVRLRASELSSAALVPAMAISETVCSVLDKLTADYGDASRAGAVIITGGTARLAGFAEYIAAEAGVPASVADNPGACVALGLGIGLG
jgi:rod shape-determining protein MreB